MMDNLVRDGAAVRDGESYKFAPITIHETLQFVEAKKSLIKQASPEVQSVIRDMVDIINSDEANDDEKHAALITLDDAISLLSLDFWA